MQPASQSSVEENLTGWGWGACCLFMYVFVNWYDWYYLLLCPSAACWLCCSCCYVVSNLCGMMAGLSVRLSAGLLVVSYILVCIMLAEVAIMIMFVLVCAVVNKNGLEYCCIN